MIRKSLWTVWSGLPNVAFEGVLTRNGQPALRHSSAGRYIWVPPATTASVLGESRKRLLFALGTKKSTIWVGCAPAGMGFREAEAHVYKSNKILDHIR